MSFIIATKCTYVGTQGIRQTTLFAIHRSHASVSPNAIVNYDDSWHFHVKCRHADPEDPVKNIIGRFFLADCLMPIHRHLHRIGTMQISPRISYKQACHDEWLHEVATQVMDELLNCEDKFPAHPSSRYKRNNELLYSPAAGVLEIKVVISGEIYYKLFLVDNALAWQIADDGFVCIHSDPLTQQAMHQVLIENNRIELLHTSELTDLKKRLQVMFPKHKLKFW